MQQLKHSRTSLLWYALSFFEDATEKITKSDDFFYECAKLNAYFYCVNVKTYQTIFEEIGLDFEAWEKKKAEIFDLDFDDDTVDILMRKIAFDEQEAETFINKIAREHGIKAKVVMGFTVEKEVAKLREILKKQGFKEFFKND